VFLVSFLNLKLEKERVPCAKAKALRREERREGREMAKEQASFFTVIVTGQIEFADVRGTPPTSTFQRASTRSRRPRPPLFFSFNFPKALSLEKNPRPNTAIALAPHASSF
jgi:hypothetical protein